MIYNYLTEANIQKFINQAIREDIGEGDHSSLASIPENAISKARLIFKEHGVIAGLDLAEKIFHTIDNELELEFFNKDGDVLEKGDIAFHIKGKARSILSSERLALNCMQRMSAIASKTRKLAELISHTKAKLLDTRKTTPNFRLPEKWAVRIGGGMNHRYALYDMIMIKDNHIDFAGGVDKAIKSTKDYLSKNGLVIDIEVETRNISEVEEVLKIGGVQRILLDNMNPDELSTCVKMINGQIETEASGGITETTIMEVAETGVDFISVGALTHSYSSLDISLKAF